MTSDFSPNVQLQGAEKVLPTIEVDCADSDEATQSCIQALRRGLAAGTGGKSGRPTTVYAYESASINFGVPTNSIWFAIGGPERILVLLHATLSSVPGVQVRFGEGIPARRCVPILHAEGGIVRDRVEGGWEVVASGAE
jgi:hypothetical protein